VTSVERHQQQFDPPVLEPRPSYPDSLNNFREALNQLPIGTHGGEVVPAFSYTALEDIDNITDDFPEFRTFVEAFLDDRPELPSAYSAKLLFNEFQYMLLEYSPDTYPAEYTSQSAWHSAFRALVLNKAISNEMRSDLASRNIQTNEPRRYAGLQLAIAAHSDKGGLITAPPSLVDAGCSAGLGLVQLKEGVPFKDVQILRASPELRHYLRQKLLGRVTLDKVVGFDQVALDKDTLRWIEANSYVTELGDEVRAAHRKFLSSKRNKSDAEVSIIKADLLDTRHLGAVRRASHSGDGKFDISSAFTALYEAKDPVKAQNELQRLARTMTVVQDYAELDPGDPAKLVFRKNIYARDSRYNLFVKYVLDRRNPSWHMLGSWGSSGRCYHFSPTEQLERLCLSGARKAT
jgi:hypothetical protein